MKFFRNAESPASFRRALALLRENYPNRESRRELDHEDFFAQGWIECERWYEEWLKHGGKIRVQRAYLVGLRRGYRAGRAE